MNRTTCGLDIAKNVMQLHWVDTETGEIGRKKLARAKLSEFFARLQPVRVVMEACGSAHPIAQGRHGQFELHIRPAALRDGQRSSTLSILCGAAVSRCSSSDASLALTR